MNGNSLSRFVHGFVDTSGPRLHCVRVHGHGPSLVLLHGIGMDWRVWQAISRRLMSHFDLYMLDLRGHGESEKPARGYTLAHYASDVEEVLERLELNHAVLLGSSLGGMVAASVEVPSDLVSHFVLVDPPLTGGPIRDETMFRTIRELKHGSTDRLAQFLAASTPGAGSFLLRSMAGMWQQAADGVIDCLLAHPLEYFSIDGSLRNLDAPTLIMQADPERGGVLSDEQAAHALSLLPRGTVVSVPNSGHAIHAFQPQEFVRIVLDFVSHH